MLGKTKRLLSLALALSMLISMMSMGVSATEAPAIPETEEDPVSVADLPEQAAPAELSEESAADEQTEPEEVSEDTGYPELTLDTRQTAVLDGQGNTCAYFTFTAPEDGAYLFTSHSATDTYGYLYDAQMNEIQYDDDSGEDHNFLLTQYLTAGTTCVICTRFLSESNVGSFDVSVSKSPMASIVVEPLTYIEETGGYWTERWNEETKTDEKYYEYDWWNDLQGTVYFTDGTSAAFNGTWFEYNGTEYGLNWSDDQQDTPWQPGNTYPVTVDAMGCEAEVAIEILASPVESIVVEPLTYIEETGGYWTERWNEETKTDEKYYEYDWWNDLQGTVYFTDGTSASFFGSGLEYNGTWYGLNWSDDQEDSPWQPGNTYTVTVDAMGCEAEAAIEILENPVESIVVEPLTYMVETGGYWATHWNEETYEEYYKYDWWNDLQGTVYFTDGTSVAFNGTSFEYNGVQCTFGYTDTQDDAHWQPGNSYTVTFGIMDWQAEFTVTIEALVESIVAEPISYIVGTGGSWNTHWNEETQTNEEYYRYNWWNDLRGTVYFTDGTSTALSGTSFKHNGEWYSINYDTNDQKNSPWQPGNTYTATFSAMGCEAELAVTINESPVESFVVEPISYIVGTAGYMAERWNEETQTDEKYYRYYWWNGLRGTINFTDGTSTAFSGTSFEYNGTWYGLNWSDDQQDTPWQPGNTYTATFSAMGCEAQAEVTITESPVESIVVEPLSYIEETGGYWNTRWNAETQTNEKYYRYDWWNDLQGTIYFADGTSLPLKGMEYKYNGQWYSLSYSDDQYNSPWQPGNTYTNTVYTMGCEEEVNVTIEESPVLAIAMDPLVMAENTGGYMYSQWNNETGAWEEYFVYEWQSLLRGTVFFIDGSSAAIDGSRFVYKGVEYVIYESDTSDTQEENHWLPGNTYLAEVSIMGVTARQIVSIASSVESKDFSYVLQNGRAIISGCTLHEKMLLIPQTIDGYPVIGVVGLGEALNYCEELIIPDCVTMLSSDVLRAYDSPMKKLTLGAGVRSLDERVLTNLRQLEYIEVSKANPYLTSLDGVVHNKDVTKLVAIPKAYPLTYRVPESITDISLLREVYTDICFLPHDGIEGYTVIDGVVYNTDVTEVYCAIKERTGTLILPETVTSMSRYALAHSNLSQVTLPAGVTEITYGAFYDSKLLEAVTIPASCEGIGSLTFDGCTGIERVYIEDLDAWCRMAFGSNPLSFGASLYLDGQRITDLVIPDTVVGTLNAGSFSGIDVNSITIPETIHTIGWSAFINTTATRINLPNSLRTIEGYAFRGSQVTQITLPEGLTNIGYGAFAKSALTSITLPDSLKSVGGHSFAECKNLVSADLGNGLTAIEYSMFGESGLKSITIPKQVRYIGESAFAYCHQLTQVNFESDELDISYYAFNNCPLQSIDLPANVNYIDYGAFQGAAAATLALPDSVTEITYRSFAFNDNLMSVVLPTSVESIDPYAFEGCDNLHHVLYEGDQQQWDQLEVESAEILAARLHLNASAEDITVRRYCHQIQHYCAVCKTWDYLDLAGEHVYKNGRCTLCGYSEYAAIIGTTGYKTLEEALAAAGANDTIKLTNNAVLDQLVLSSGAKLDLNGLSMEVSRGIVVFSGEIIDSSEGDGVLITEKGGLVLIDIAPNTYIPLYDTEVGGYRFFTYNVTVKGVRNNADGSITYGFRFDFGSPEAFEVLSHTENSGVANKFVLSWGNNTKTFTFSDELMREYVRLTAQYGDRVALMVNVTGLQALTPGTQLTAVASITSDRGLSKSAQMVYTTKA